MTNKQNTSVADIPLAIYRNVDGEFNGGDVLTREVAEAAYERHPAWADMERSDIGASLADGDGCIDAIWVSPRIGTGVDIELIRIDKVHTLTGEVREGSVLLRYWTDDGPLDFETAADARASAAALLTAAAALESALAGQPVTAGL
jgi:hypothetical protein